MLVSESTLKAERPRSQQSIQQHSHPVINIINGDTGAINLSMAAEMTDIIRDNSNKNSRLRQNTNNSQLEKGSRLKGGLRPSVANTSKSNTSSVCVIGGMGNGEWLEKRYEQRAEGKGTSHVRSSAKKLLDASEVAAVAKGSNSREMLVPQDPNEKYRQTTGGSKYSRTTFRSKKRKRTPGMVTSSGIPPNGVGLTTAQNSSHNPGQATLQSHEMTGTMGGVFSTFCSNQPAEEQLIFQAQQTQMLQSRQQNMISSGSHTLLEQTKRARPFSAVVRHGIQAAQHQINTGPSYSGHIQFSNRVSPANEPATSALSQNQKHSGSSRIKSANRKNENDLTIQSVVGESINFQNSGVKPPRFTQGTTLTGSSLATRDINQLKQMQASHGNATWVFPTQSHTMSGSTTRPLSSKYQRLTSNNQQRLRRHFEPLIYRNQQQQSAGQVSNMVMSPDFAARTKSIKDITSNGAILVSNSGQPTTTAAHMIRLAHLQHKQNSEKSQSQFQTLTEQPILSTLEQASSQPSAAVPKESFVKVKQQNDLSSSHGSPPQVRISNQVFARTQSGVRSIGHPQQSPMTATLNSNLLQNEVLRKSLQTQHALTIQAQKSFAQSENVRQNNGSLAMVTRVATANRFQDRVRQSIDTIKGQVSSPSPHDLSGTQREENSFFYADDQVLQVMPTLQTTIPAATKCTNSIIVEETLSPSQPTDRDDTPGIGRLGGVRNILVSDQKELLKDKTETKTQQTEMSQMLEEPYGEHNMQPQLISRRNLLRQQLLQQALIQINSRAPVMASNSDMHALLKKHTTQGMSWNARRRLEQMESCGIESNALRKSAKVQQRKSQNLGLSKTKEVFPPNAQRFLLESVSFLNPAPDNRRVTQNELERLGQQARLHGGEFTIANMPKSPQSHLQKRKLMSKMRRYDDAKSLSVTAQPIQYQTKRFIKVNKDKTHVSRSKKHQTKRERQLSGQLTVQKLKIKPQSLGKRKLSVASEDLIQDGVVSIEPSRGEPDPSKSDHVTLQQINSQARSSIVTSIPTASPRDGNMRRQSQAGCTDSNRDQKVETTMVESNQQQHRGMAKGRDSIEYSHNHSPTSRNMAAAQSALMVVNMNQGLQQQQKTQSHSNLLTKETVRKSSLVKPNDKYESQDQGVAESSETQPKQRRIINLSQEWQKQSLQFGKEDQSRQVETLKPSDRRTGTVEIHPQTEADKRAEPTISSQQKEKMDGEDRHSTLVSFEPRHQMRNQDKERATTHEVNPEQRRPKSQFEVRRSDFDQTCVVTPPEELMTKEESMGSIYFSKDDKRPVKLTAQKGQNHRQRMTRTCQGHNRRREEPAAAKTMHAIEVQDFTINLLNNPTKEVFGQPPKTTTNTRPKVSKRNSALNKGNSENYTDAVIGLQMPENRAASKTPKLSSATLQKNPVNDQCQISGTQGHNDSQRLGSQTVLSENPIGPQKKMSVHNIQFCGQSRSRLDFHASISEKRAQSHIATEHLQSSKADETKKEATELMSRNQQSNMLQGSSEEVNIREKAFTVVQQKSNINLKQKQIADLNSSDFTFAEEPSMTLQSKINAENGGCTSAPQTQRANQGVQASHATINYRDSLSDQIETYRSLEQLRQNTHER